MACSDDSMWTLYEYVFHGSQVAVDGVTGVSGILVEGSNNYIRFESSDENHHQTPQ